MREDVTLGMEAKFERKIFWESITLAFLIHVAVVVWFLTAPTSQPGPEFKTLAVMEFAHYDPAGGQEGGGVTNDQADELPAPEELLPPPEPEASVSQPEAEPEPAELPQVVESTSELAAPAPVAPPKPVVKEKPKDKPKPKAKPKDKPKADPGPKARSDSQATPGGNEGPGKGGQGGGTGQGNPKAEKAYLAKIRNKINRLKKYPPAAKSQKLEGVVTVNFTINRSGAVTSARIVSGSGHSLLDQEVTALMKRVSPFPPMPDEMAKNSLNLTVPIQFSLK